MISSNGQTLLSCDSFQVFFVWFRVPFCLFHSWTPAAGCKQCHSLVSCAHRTRCQTSLAPSRPLRCPQPPQTLGGKTGAVRAQRCRLHQGHDPYQWVRSIRLSVTVRAVQRVNILLRKLAIWPEVEASKITCCSLRWYSKRCFWWNENVRHSVSSFYVLWRSAWKPGQLRCAGHYWVHSRAGHGSGWIQMLQVLPETGWPSLKKTLNDSWA